MPGPNHPPRGGFLKPRDMKKTALRLLRYLTASPLPLVLVFLFLLLSVLSNIGGSYMIRGITNNFLYSGCRDFAGLSRSIGRLVLVYLAGCAATYCQSAIPKGGQPAAPGDV